MFVFTCVYGALCPALALLSQTDGWMDGSVAPSLTASELPGDDWCVYPPRLCALSSADFRRTTDAGGVSFLVTADIVWLLLLAARKCQSE